MKRNLVRVIVSVEDNNDNTPSFTSPRYSARVLETAALGSAVAQVSALDRDKRKSSELLYSIDSGMPPHSDQSFCSRKSASLGILSVIQMVDTPKCLQKDF